MKKKKEWLNQARLDFGLGVTKIHSASEKQKKWPRRLYRKKQ